MPLLAGSCCQRRRQTRNEALRVLFVGFCCPPKSIIFTRCFKPCPCAFVGAFFGCFRRRCSSYSLCFLDARAKVRLAKIDTPSTRKPVFWGLRPRRRSRNEDNSGSKNDFKKRLKKQPKVCENDDFSGSGAELQKHRPKLPPRPSPGPSGERPGRPKTAPRSAKSCPRRGKSGPRTAKTAPRGHQERLQRW